MKAIKVAVFFDWMKNVMVSFSVDELQGTTFRSHFGAVGLGDAQELKWLLPGSLYNRQFCNTG